MILLLPPAALTFTMYYFLFNWFFFYVERVTLDRAKAFSLGIYACFAISVLWEWPIQLTVFQNVDAVIMSSLKALGILFFYLTLRKDKLKMNDRLGFYISLALFLGVALTISIYIFGIQPNIYVSHAYRIPWFFVLMRAINSTYKPLNKDSLIIDFGPMG